MDSYYQIPGTLDSDIFGAKTEKAEPEEEESE